MEKREIKEAADRILHTYGLLDLLRPLGTPHVIGSYRMDMMAWNDLDIDIENSPGTSWRFSIPLGMRPKRR